MRKKITIFLICLLLISSSTTIAFTTFNRDKQQKHPFFYSTPTPLSTPKRWIKTFGGIANDICLSVEQTFDGGYIIAGWTSSYGYGKADFWLIKTDNNGIEKWNRTFGGIDYDYGESVQQTTDGGYIITGITNFSYNTGYGDFWLIKTDNNGIEEWNRTFGGTNVDWPHSVQQTTDGGYIIMGVSNSFESGNEDIYLVKTDSDGTKLWDKTFGRIGQDLGYSIQQTSEEGYIITGGTYSSSTGSYDIWLIKTDINGDETWNKTYGGISSDNGYYVQQTTDGGYIVIGYTYSFSAGKEDIWLIKTDRSGNKVWDKTFGGIDHDGGYSVQQIIDGGYILIGYTNSFDDGNYNVWMIKTDNNGIEEWSRKFGGTSTDDNGHSIKQTNDGGYIILGNTKSYETGDYDVLLIKTDSQGKSKTISSGSLYFKKLFQCFQLFEKILNQII